ncbi:efflux transporter outer membrane subunit [Verrucomicrobiales bacterium BCK34]|nr:efflux transporter outer membrane subunit [Verrucomicrobiales bacterium BCK34]
MNIFLREPFAISATFVAAMVISVLPSGCVVHEVDTVPLPAVKHSGEAKVSGSLESAGRGSKEVAGWWTGFQDETLNALVGESLADNPDVRSLGRRIDQANSRLIQAGSTLFPQIDGDGSFESDWGRTGRRSDEASLGLDLNWELDFWGRIRSGRNARAEEVVVAREDWLAARLLLTGSVAETWYSIVEQRGQLKLVREQIDLSKTLLNLTRLRFGQGQSSVVDVRQQQEQMQSTESLVPDIEFRIAELELALDTLTGSVPGSRNRIARSRFDSLPASPRTGYPSGLLLNRPDLRARRASIVALDHEIGEAIADCLPSITISGSMALSGTPSLDRLVGDAIAGVTGPIFDAGNRKAEVALRRARVQEELDLYAADYLTAVQEVETALVQERKLRERLQLQRSQLSTARRLLTESRSRYSQGVTDYLPVLDALAKVQELERRILSSQREQHSARIALHLALGGPVPEPG